MITLPQISLAKLAADATRREERQRLRLACEEYGFFYLIEHGIPKEQIAQAIEASRRFFALPQSIKDRYGHASQSIHPSTARGYSPLHGEMLHPEAGHDPKEVFDLGMENEGDRRPFAGCTHFPDDAVAPGFARSLLALQATVLNCVVPQIGTALADLIDMEQGWFQRYFSPPTILHRVIRYPSGGTAGKHTDHGFFTLLLQEELPTRSLQVWFRERWMPVPSLPDSLVVNLGDMLQTLSDDHFKSTPHQVVHSGRTDRISLPFFVYPDIDARLSSRQGQHTFSVAEMLLRNMESIWETGNGAGRARELQ